MESPPARREPLAFRPKAVGPDAPQIAAPFRPAGLSAAVARRPDAEVARDRPFPSRGNEPPPEIDIDARLAEAYHRGVREGMEVAREEAAAARAEERAETQRRGAAERLAFQMNEYAKLADAITGAFARIERGIADNVARVLKPLVSRAITDQAVEQLAANMARMHQPGRPGMMRIRGPEALLGALKRRIAPLGVEVEYSIEDDAEITVEAGDTTIRSELRPWAELIESLAEA